MTHNDDESLVLAIAEVFHVGLIVCDALNQLARGHKYAAKITFDGQEWMVEARTTPKQIVKITLIE